ncbi:phosphatase PAP2 family protein [Paracerasibacillus soli]|uniref:Phosphatase PAP2 family protein n=2 Tax=Paracerasibacillus soli TaxID=480284 RepID=A0ABU5CNL3_9BACI|nr:phosphatase PAP2 family protein [Virgibacillus soli]MDY0407825.1 phosphatase PAP2 family protein [Virgibacillus soli]
MVSIVCYGLLAYFIARECKTRAEKLIIEWSFITFILLIGVSRFFINVHYLTDILTGFFVGYTFLVILVYIFEKIEKRRGRGERLRLKTE